MTRNSALKVLNPIMAILILNQLITVFSHDSMSHETYELLHMNGGWALGAAIALHVTLNFDWVRANLLPKALGGTKDES